MEIEIRDFTETDRGQLLGLVRELQAYESLFHDRMKDPGDMGQWYIDELLKNCAAHDGVIRVAVRGEDLLGYLCVLGRISSQDEADETDYNYALVADLLVSETARGLGLGRRLLKDAEDLARKCGSRWLRISVLADNTRARKIYERFGFKDLFVQLEKPLA